LHPTPQHEAQLTGDNNHSVVLRLLYGQRSILLTGDIQVEAEAQLLHKLPPTDVLKVPHHGSTTSSSAPFLAALKPKIAIVSCGVDNRFGLPAAQVLQRYQEHGIALYRTDRHGLIMLRTQGQQWQLQTYRE